MKQSVLSIAGICLFSALCEQIMDKNRYFRVFRMALGLQLAAVIVGFISETVKLIKI